MAIDKDLEKRYGKIIALTERYKPLVLKKDTTDVSLPYEAKYKDAGIQKELISSLVNKFQFLRVHNLKNSYERYEAAAKTTDKTRIKSAKVELSESLEAFEKKYLAQHQDIINLVERLHQILDKNAPLTAEETKLKKVFQDYKIKKDNSSGMNETLDRQEKEDDKKIAVDFNQLLALCHQALQPEKKSLFDNIKQIFSGNDEPPTAKAIQPIQPLSVEDQKAALNRKIAAYVSKCETMTVKTYQTNNTALSNEIKMLHREIDNSKLSNVEKLELSTKMTTATVDLTNRIRIANQAQTIGPQNDPAPASVETVKVQQQRIDNPNNIPRP